MAGFFTKLFGLGQLPPELTAAAQAGSTLLVAEGITVKGSGHLRSPTRTSSGFTALHKGALVIVPGRVLGSFGRYVILDDAVATTPADASTTCSIGESGVRVVIDIARLIPGGTGEVTVELRTPIPSEVLAALGVDQWQGRVAAADPQRMLQRI